jgi:cysteinyl-tRNA synthetase
MFSEAHNNSTNWCGHWIHTGHIYIDGLKMSKSLKNFITIKEFLHDSKYANPSVDLRIFLLQHKYSSDLHFSEERIHEASHFRQRIEGFLSLVDNLRQNTETYRKYTPGSMALYSTLLENKRLVLDALSDDINTPVAMNCISHLITECIAYAQSIELRLHPIEPLIECGLYVSDFFLKMGVFPHSALATKVQIYS